MRKLTQEEFINKANNIHKFKFDYSMVLFLNVATKIDIICPIHGIFSQIAKGHLDGQGCKKCSYSKNGKKRRMNNSDFIKSAQKIHNNKYDYSKTEYISSEKKVTIICKNHGEFEQVAGNHLQKRGCIKCKEENTAKRKKYTLDIFIEKANIVHKNKYSYLNADYSGSSKKITITCPIHGDFNQQATTHLQGSGCPICNESSGEKLIRWYLEENKIKYIAQKTFDNLYFNKGYPFRFDFYIPEKNLLIEFDGRQHFKPHSFIWKNESNKKKVRNLEYQQLKDNIKNKYAKDNNINLLRISYSEINNIKNILDRFIGEK